MKKQITLFLIALLLYGCSSNNKEYPSPNEPSPSPTIDQLKLPQASQSATATDYNLVLIDYSNINQGYFQIKTLHNQHSKIKIQVKKDNTYTYDMNHEMEYETFPFTEGNGSYTIKVFEHIDGDRYALMYSIVCNVSLEDENLPFLYPNQIVWFSENHEAIKLSFQLTEGKKTELERILAIYEYVIKNIRYDDQKAEDVTNNYVIPAIDVTLEIKKGICFDYAALTAAMLRAQQIPAKVITGYVDEGYHAWVEVFVKDIGWINPKTYFSSYSWTRMDPTYDAGSDNYKGSYQDLYYY